MKTVSEMLRTFVVIASVAAVVGAMFFLGDRYLQIREKQLKFSAIDACGQVGRVSFESKDAVTGQVTRSELPATDSYKQCLKEKGIEVNK